jgi:hypothetical protein
LEVAGDGAVAHTHIHFDIVLAEKVISNALWTIYDPHIAACVLPLQARQP